MYQCGFETFPFTEDSCAHSRTSFILLSLFNYAGFMAHTWFLCSSLAQHSWCELWAMPRRFLQTLRSTSRVTHWMHTWVAISSTYFIHPLFDCCCCYFICLFFIFKNFAWQVRQTTNESRNTHWGCKCRHVCAASLQTFPVDDEYLLLWWSAQKIKDCVNMKLK